MTKFEKIYEFEELPKTCNADVQCKLADYAYAPCGGRSVFVYSSLVIRGKNEQHLLSMSKEVIERERANLQLEECTGGPTPSRGVCWKKGCEIIRTWRQ